MEYIDVPCANGSTFKIKIKSVLFSNASPFQKIAVYDTELFGRCLFLDGVIQICEGDHEVYDRALLRKLRREDRRILVLGGGDGYTAETALRMNLALEVIVVEIDPAVLDASKRHMARNVFYDPRLKVNTGEALNFLREDLSTWDGIVCDFTELPVGGGGKGLEFFSAIFSLSRARLNEKGWIGVYAGMAPAPVERLLREHMGAVELAEVFVPSFGEPVYFLFGEKR